MRRHTWYVWNDQEKELFKGSHTAALAYYKKYGGYKAGLHLGYIIWEEGENHESKTEL